MYEEYFSFSGPPFKLNPDPRFFFGSRSHNKAMAYLHYGLRQAECFIVITGEIGAGKSMMIGHLLDQLDRSRITAAHLLTPNLQPEDLLSHILSAFRIEAAGDGKTADLEAFEDFLFDQLNQGKRVLLIVDEAQNLPKETLEELRVLSNIDYDGTPLFQVFLVGQPEFRSILAAPDMEQLRQRIIASYHLEPLSREEQEEYIKHRLAVVGWADDPSFTNDAFDVIFSASQGVPRKTNKLCNRILLYCSLEKINHIDAAVVHTVINDLSEENVSNEFSAPPQPSAVAAKPGLTTAESSEPDPAIAEEVEKPIAAVTQDGQSEAADDADSPAIDDDAASAGGEPVAARAPATDEAVVEAPLDFSDEDAKDGDADAGLEDIVHEAPSSSLDEDGGKLEPRSESAMSVFDRLKAKRKKPSDGLSAPDNPENQALGEDAGTPPAISGHGGDDPASASIDDVAMAIAVASAHSAASHGPEAGEDDGQSRDDEPSLRLLTMSPSDPDWRDTVTRTLDETRTDLKRARVVVKNVQRKVSDDHRRRKESKLHIEASLDRAESLLGEIKSAWR